MQSQTQTQSQTHTTREVSYQPRVSMRRDVHYTTQQGVWDCHIMGELTDADIRRYAKQGRYGQEYKEKMLARQRAKAGKKNASKKAVQHILDLITE